MYSPHGRGCIIYFNLAPAVKHSFAADENAVAGELAKKFAPALRDLPRE
jgi:hypothetical protein